MRWIVIIPFCLLIATHGVAQRKMKQRKPASFKRHYNEVLPKAPQFKPSGWLVAPGATYMLTQFVAKKEEFDQGASGTFEGRYRALGKPGIYVEGGRYQMMAYNPIFKYFDYGISYKMLRGSERSKGEWLSTPSELVLSSESASGTFGYHYAEAFFNLNHIWRISKYTFLQHTIGANAGYAFISDMSGTSVPASVSPVNSPGSISTQLHYKIGYGIKMRGNWILIPSLETPVLNLLPFEPPRSAYGFFNSRYRPLIFSLRFFFIRPANTMDCTPVRTKDGIFMPTDMNKQKEMDEQK